MANLKDLSAQLNQLKSQIPFAMSKALTSVARQIEEAERKGLERHLDNPTPFMSCQEMRRRYGTPKKKSTSR